MTSQTYAALETQKHTENTFRSITKSFYSFRKNLKYFSNTCYREKNFRIIQNVRVSEIFKIIEHFKTFVDYFTSIFALTVQSLCRINVKHFNRRRPQAKQLLT